MGKGRSRALVARKGLERAIADHLSVFYDFLKRHGRATMIWADFVIHYPKLLDLLPTDLILSNWNYATLDPYDSFEHDNHHYAKHPELARRGHPLWVCGACDWPGTLLPVVRTIETSTNIWLDLCRRVPAEGYLITEWGRHFRKVPRLLGNMLVLMKLQDPALTSEAVLEEFSRRVLGRKDAEFVTALRLLTYASDNPEYFEARCRHADFPGCFVWEDPTEYGWGARRFGRLDEAGLDKFLEDMRTAERLLAGVSTNGVPHPAYVAELRGYANRAVVSALLGQLWYELAWDTGYLWHNRDTLAPRRRLLEEVRQRARADQQWERAGWRRENLESELRQHLAALARPVARMAKVLRGE